MTWKLFGLNMQVLSHTVQANGKNSSFLKKIAISNERLTPGVCPKLYRIIIVDPQALPCSEKFFIIVWQDFFNPYNCQMCCRVFYHDPLKNGHQDSL